MIGLDWAIAAVVVLAGDQVSKLMVVSRPPFRGPVARPSFLAIRVVLNRRGALVPFVGVRMLLVLWVALVAAAVLSVHYGMLGDNLVGRLGVGAAVGGATGNLIDRLCRGGIVDFIAVGLWPVFNLADAAIVAGLGLAVAAIVA
jgi:signal peptidase II